jgi:hypothetical protein
MIATRSGIAAVAVAIALAAPAGSRAAEPFQPQTRVKLDGSFWLINGKRTYADAPAEGLLLNVRMANALFEDRNSATAPKGFDAEKNTDAFIAKVPDYVKAGFRAFTVNLQGGNPGYEGALCSSFEPDGALRPDAMKRAARLIEACDRAGAAVILGFFSAEGDQVLKDDDAVKRAVKDAAAWVKEKGYGNVLIEVADEYIAPGYDREVLKDPVGMAGLVRLAKAAAPGILVSVSGGGGGRIARQVATAADFILLHFHNIPLSTIPQRAAAASKVSKAVVCNGDRRTGEDGASALEAAVNSFASWGFANPKNEKHPFQYDGPADDPVVYAKLKEVTTPAK